jgi:hypothetical protein
MDVGPRRCDSVCFSAASRPGCRGCVSAGADQRWVVARQGFGGRTADGAHRASLYLRGWAAMREAEPSAQLTRGLVGCTPIKRHQRPRTTWYSSDLGTPLIPADGRHFDVVFAAIDGFFEAMNGKRHATKYEAKSMNWAVNPTSILVVRGGGRKRKDSRRRIHMQHAAANWNNARKKIRDMSECPQAFHCSSTCFPQPRCARCSSR